MRNLKRDQGEEKGGTRKQHSVSRHVRQKLFRRASVLPLLLADEKGRRRDEKKREEGKKMEKQGQRERGGVEEQHDVCSR